MSSLARMEAPTPFGPIVAAVEHDGAADVEIVVRVPSDLTLPDGRAVDGYRRFEVTIRATDRVSLTSSFGFEEAAPTRRFGFAGGQYLAAAEMSDMTGCLTVATHDGEWLTSCGVGHGFVPARFAALGPDRRETLVRYGDQGLVVCLPELDAGENVRLFLACAWTLGTRTDDSADDWLAAEAALPWRFPQNSNP